MNHSSAIATTLAVVSLCFSFAESPAWADSDKGKGKGHAQEQHERSDDRDARADRRGELRFAEHQRVAVHEYFREEERGGRCPPGLAKKRNGCMPPGQAKKWSKGRPLPRDVIYYEVPQQLVVKIGVPPPGYKYVRVASDILMIAVGTAMVVDAIEDLGRR